MEKKITLEIIVGVLETVDWKLLHLWGVSRL